MRSLRADNAKHVTDNSRLAEKNAEERRKADLAAAAEAAMRTQLKSAEAAVRGLKEELARTKTLVSQARTACATEVRRRDRQMDALKKQLAEAARSRGARGNPSVTTIVVTGGEAGQLRSRPPLVPPVNPERRAGCPPPCRTSTRSAPRPRRTRPPAPPPGGAPA